MYKALTIAGSDSSGGAGIQADIKTMTAHGVYAMSVITALTAQNTTGVYGIMPVATDFVSRQLDCVFQDITPDAVKIGMVADADVIEAIADKLANYKAANIVLDPVMVATSGSRLSNDSAVTALVEKLFPMAAVITPNIPEAEYLCGIKIRATADMEKAAAILADKTGGAVIIKGGHLTQSADDLLYQNGKAEWFCLPRVENPNNHGTGCTLSSAIACGLARGLSVSAAFAGAKKYITGALTAGLDLGKGSGPLNHCFGIAGDDR